MPNITAPVLAEKLKAGELDNHYFFYGKEVYRIRQAVEAVTKKAVGSDRSDFNFQVFDSHKIPMGDIINSYISFPFFAEKKCVWIKNLDVEKLSKPDLEDFINMISNKNPSTVLIYFITGFEIDMKKQDKWKKFVSLFSKYGTVCEFSPKNRSETAADIISRAKKNRCVINRDNAYRLIDSCGNSLELLMNEVDKLAAYAGEGNEITAAHIDACAVKTVDSTVYDLSKAIVKGSYGKAYNLLDELFYQKIKPVFILGAISSAFMDMYRAKAARGRTAAEIIKDFSYAKNRSFVVSNALRDSAPISADLLRKYVVLCSEADVMLKTSAMDKRVVFEQLIAKMITAGQRR